MTGKLALERYVHGRTPYSAVVGRSLHCGHKITIPYLYLRACWRRQEQCRKQHGEVYVCSSLGDFLPSLRQLRYSWVA